MTLRRQIFIAISVVFLGIFIVLTVLGIQGTRNYLEEQLGTHAQETASSLAHPLAQSLGKGDMALATTQLATLFDRGYFQRIAVLGTDGTVLLEKGLPPKIEEVPLWFSEMFALDVPAGEAFVTAGWRQLGKVLVIPQPTHAYQHLWLSTEKTAAWMLLAYLFALFLTHQALRYILNPLSQIEFSALEIQQKRFRQITVMPRALELARVVRAMNNMSRKIAEILDIESAKGEVFRKEAYQDGLTGLDNRRSFDLRLGQLFDGEIQFSEGALIGLEVNNLKEFNTEASYREGDAYLVALAGAARDILGEKAMFLCRTGGASFAFAVIGLDTKAVSSLSHALQLGLLKAVTNEDGEVPISFSVGVVNFHPGDKRGQVMARLDLAIESARQAGRNACQYVPDATSGSGGIGSLAWRQLINDALVENRWILVGQPVVSLTTGAVIHQEIMSRLIGSDGNLVPASTFLPMAMRHHLMADIDRALLSLVFNIVEARGAGSSMHLAVNMSNQSLENGDFVQWLSGRLARLEQNVLPLSFELSEYACAVDMKSAQDFAAMVRSHRAHFGIDHFGLAPDSLQILRQLPPDYIKLDAGLVAEAPTNAVARSLLRSIVALANSLEIEVIAQGVETAQQVESLLQDQIGGGQGYHFGAPTSEALQEKPGI